MHRTNVAVFLGMLLLVGTMPFLMLAVYAARRRRDRADAPERSSARLAAGILVTVVALGVIGVGLYRSVAPSVAGGDDMTQMASMAPMRSASGIESALPRRLAGSTMRDELTGASAVEAVGSLHGLSFDIVDAVVATYDGAGGRVEVWGSTTDSTGAADDMVRSMADRIAEGHSPFSMPLEQGAGIWRTRGLGAVHYFFAGGGAVWWVTAEPGSIDAALEQVLEVAGR